MTRPDYIVDIQGLQPTQARAPDPRSLRGRPWIAVHWKCCSAYSRIYRNAAGTAYEGGCPKCGRRTKARIGPNGTATRFFEAR
ncbi:MAG: hypothetical protein ACODAQ_08670 [Phycisphaeraceae bacterium]